MRRFCAVTSLLIGLLASTCQARVLWEDNGFMLESGGWVNEDSIVEWTGVLCGLTLPDKGWFSIEEAGAVELYIPSKGWVKDKGILVMKQCTPFVETDRRTCCITAAYRCPREEDRVTLIIKIPKMYPAKEDRPTKARWVKRKVEYCEAN